MNVGLYGHEPRKIFHTVVEFYTLAPISEADRKESVDFLTQYSPEKVVAERVDSLIQSHRLENYGLIMRNQKKKFVGIWRIRRGLDPRSLMVVCRLEEKYRNKGIISSAWRWIVKEVFMEAYKQRKTLPLNSDEKLPLELAKVQVVLHPEDRLRRMKIEQQGFRVAGAIQIDGDKEKKRLLYEIGMGDLLRI